MEIRLFKRLILLIFSSLLFFSCVTEEPQPTTESRLVGEWEVTSLEYSGTTVTEYEGFSYSIDYTGLGSNIVASYTFSENPNNFSGSGTYDTILTITSEGESYEQTFEGLGFAYSGSWSVDRDKVTLTSNNESSSATIVSLTDTELELKMNEEQTQTIEGTTVTIEVEMLLKLSKK